MYVCVCVCVCRFVVVVVVVVVVVFPFLLLTKRWAPPLDDDWRRIPVFNFTWLGFCAKI